MDIKIRPLIVTDVFTVARMLSKVTKGAKTELATAITARRDAEPLSQEDWNKLNPGERKEQTKKQGEAQAKIPAATELGLAIFQSVFVEAEEDLKIWLSSLIGKTLEEFERMSATTVVDVIEALVVQEDVGDFFTRVSQLVTLVENRV